METIRDGRGKGHTAGVSTENMLMVRSMNISHAFHHARYHANAYVATVEHVFAAADTSEVVANIAYNGSHVLVMARMAFNADSAGLTEIYLKGGATVIAGGTQANILNTNSGSRQTIDVELLETDHGAYPITVATEGTKMWEIFMGYHTTTYTELPTESAFIITPGTYITIVSKSAAIGDKVGINFFFYEEGDI